MVPESHCCTALLVWCSIHLAETSSSLTAESWWCVGQWNSRSKCQVSGCDMVPQTTMSSCQGILWYNMHKVSPPLQQLTTSSRKSVGFCLKLIISTDKHLYLIITTKCVCISGCITVVPTKVVVSVRGCRLRLVHFLKFSCPTCQVDLASNWLCHRDWQCRCKGQVWSLHHFPSE